MTLRPLGLEDADSLWSDVRDPELRRLTGTRREFTYNEIVSYCSSRDAETSRITLAITGAGSGAWLGEIVLMDYDGPNRSAGLRIALTAGARGRGFGTEALHALLAHAFGPLALHRVSLEVYEFNARAIRVHQKLGFQPEGRLRDALWWDGQAYDTVLMSILASEWNSDPVAP